jgi:hypothetical protein
MLRQSFIMHLPRANVDAYFDFAYTLFSGDAFGTSVGSFFAFIWASVSMIIFCVCTFYRLRDIARIIYIFHTLLFDNAVEESERTDAVLAAPSANSRTSSPDQPEELAVNAAEGEQPDQGDQGEELAEVVKNDFNKLKGP